VALLSDTWKNALERYKYEVDLKLYCGGQRFPHHFNQHILGDRNSTIDFENYFKEKCQSEIEPWFEVVFWKMYSQPNHRQSQTYNIVQKFLKSKVQPSKLYEAARKFIEFKTEDGAKNAFRIYQRMFYPSSGAIATVATFPAFLDPHNFPMVDTNIARWVNRHFPKFNAANPDAPQLIPSKYGSDSTTVLTMRDFPFYFRWIQWTRYYARELNMCDTGINWRPRDVEMAVFTAWRHRNGSANNSSIELNPI
jgi:hypothetical protein